MPADALPAMPADALPALPHGQRGYREVERAPDILDIKTFLVLTMIAGFIGLGAWMSLARLDAATATEGELRVESHRKTLKVLESGMVRRLLVSDGAKVIAGQPLIELDPTRANANVEIYRRSLYATQAALARYQAEAAGHRTLRFPDALLARADDPDIRPARSEERRVGKECVSTGR